MACTHYDDIKTVTVSNKVVKIKKGFLYLFIDNQGATDISFTGIRGTAIIKPGTALNIEQIARPYNDVTIDATGGLVSIVWNGSELEEII